MTALKMIKPSDPSDAKKDILKRLGDLSGFEIANNEVLVAIYMRPEMTPGGIILTPTNLKEDLYQAKAALVVKIGSACRFERTDSDGVTYGIPISLYDWVVVKPSDAWSLDVNTNPGILDRKDFVNCRLVYADQIRARISHPAMVW